MHYSICPPTDVASASILAASLAALESDTRMRAERVKLERVSLVQLESGLGGARRSAV